MALNKSAAQVTIANGQSLSAPVNLGNKTLCAIVVPTPWTAAALSFQASDDGGVTWQNLFDVTGTEVSIPSASVVAGQRISVNPAIFASVDFVKIRSGTNAAAVAQGGARVLGLATREIYGTP
jgi:hypothetical protein